MIARAIQAAFDEQHARDLASMCARYIAEAVSQEAAA